MTTADRIALRLYPSREKESPTIIAIRAIVVDALTKMTEEEIEDLLEDRRGVQ